MAVHRMLVVEDHEGIRFAFRGIFSRMGWKVRVAKTVAEGLASLGAEPDPCCLILDLDMPDGRSEAVLEEVRAKGMKTRVVVCTGSMDADRLSAVAELKPDALLTKPITLEDVWSGVCRVCDPEAA